MKKMMITVLVLTFALGIKAQTRQLEKESLKERYEANEFSVEEYQELAEKWHDIVKDYGEYPDLPYNPETKKMEYRSIHQFPELTKDIVFSRILEWAAVNQGSISEIKRYSNREDGKIVLELFSDMNILDEYNNSWGKSKKVVDNINAYYTYVFTLKEKTTKVEIVNVDYEFNYGGYYENGNYVAPYTRTINISSLIPVTDSPKERWRRRLSTLVETSRHNYEISMDIDKYIREYKKDYDF